METMKFCIAQTNFFKNIFLHSGDPTEQFGTNEKLYWLGWKIGQNRPRVKLFANEPRHVISNNVVF